MADAPRTPALFHAPPLRMGGRDYPSRPMTYSLAVLYREQVLGAPNAYGAMVAAADFARELGWPEEFGHLPAGACVAAIRTVIQQLDAELAQNQPEQLAPRPTAPRGSPDGTVVAFLGELRKLYPGDAEVSASLDLLRATWTGAEAEQLDRDLRWIGEQLQELLRVWRDADRTAQVRSRLRTALLTGRLGPAGSAE